MAIVKIPQGVTPDSMGFMGMIGLMSNVNNYAEGIATVASTGTSMTLTSAQLLAGVTNITSGASGGFTINLPSTVAIIAALGPSIPTDGSYSEPIHFINNGTGQTGTVTAGDSGTTFVSGLSTATVANNVTRKYILTVTSPTTITLANVGTLSL